MDKITKFLSKLTHKEQEKILHIIQLINMWNWEQLDHTKLVGQDNMYRVRVGKIRIIYSIDNNKGQIINIDYRGNVYQ